MTISGFALITLVLFMVHEFEEIIFVRRYIDKHADNNRYHDELFVAGQDHYPSTAAIAAMIAEEFVVACLILCTGIILDSAEVVAAMFIAYTLHLVIHIREAIVFPGWAPGSRTAVFTMPVIALTLYAAAITLHIDYLKLAILTVVLGALVLLNLQALYRLSEKIETLIQKIA
ncbi:HXXEE domain-containing protein [Rothia aeria]|uniref:HXXEE domain-containing protein n=1 Tax=Rothia aeria TaxID=172042 RepID=UPI0028E78D81|nr:HXXEE domain-containing protein [Rothia aeria]